MSLYYLMAQLPSLDGLGEESVPPITESEFLELCTGLSGKKVISILDKLTLIPSRNLEITGSAVIDGWNTGERQLRLALSMIRAKKMGRSIESGNESTPSQITAAAHTASDMDDPLEAERFLNRMRLNFLETLRPMDSFADDSLFYYGIKLKLLWRMQKFDETQGRSAYRNIYDSVMNGEKREIS